MPKQSNQDHNRLVQVYRELAENRNVDRVWVPKNQNMILIIKTLAVRLFSLS